LPNSGAFSLLCQEISGRLIGRLGTFQRNFKTCWQIGDDTGILAGTLTDPSGFFTTSDLAPLPHVQVVCDEDCLPIKKNSLDLLISFLSLHAVNDIPGTLIQCLDSLKPDGLFLAVFIGGETLFELRTIFQHVEIEHHQGLSQRFMPLITTKDAGQLLGRAGFALPVTDVDKIVVRYPSVRCLLDDLKKTTNTTILNDRSHPALSRKFLSRVDTLYQKQFPSPEGGIQATFELIYMTGWAPAPSQQQALLPGSAQHSLKDFLNT